MEPPVAQTIHYFQDNGIVPPLHPNEYTLGELFCELITIKSNEDPNIRRFLKSEGVIYPHIVIPLVAEVNAQQGELEVDKQTVSSNIFTGLIKSFEKYFSLLEENETESYSDEAPVPKSPTEHTSRVSSAIRVISDAIKYTFQGLIRPNKLLPSEICSHPEDPIRSFSWHNYLSKFAVALRNNTVRIYDMNNGSWSPMILKHEFQKNVFAISWKPMSGNTLAVSTRHGILIWTILSKTVHHQPSAKPLAQILSTTSGSVWSNLGLDHQPSQQTDTGAWCNHLHYPGFSPINTLDWSPSGRYLAAGSINSGQLLIWDVVTETPTPLVQYCLGNIRKVLWSPNDEYVAVFTGSDQFRVFQTRNWASQRWSGLSSHVLSAAWSADGYHLAFTVNGEEKFYIVRYSSEENSVTGTLVSVVDFSSYQVQRISSKRNVNNRSDTPPISDDIGNSEMSFGGKLTHIAWDPTSSRLVVALERSALIAVFQCNSMNNGVSLQPLGYIRGPADTETTSLQFRPNFPRGALLAATFSNGKIAFYPMYFKPTVK